MRSVAPMQAFPFLRQRFSIFDQIVSDLACVADSSP
jgi:hypothetical protein